MHPKGKNPTVDVGKGKNDADVPHPHMASVVSFKYEGNSELLRGIYEAIERGVIN